MKFSQHILNRPSSGAKHTRAFTLAEIMVVVVIFSFIVIALVSVQLFGLTMGAISASKMKATSDSLKVLNSIRDEVKEATNIVQVGNYTTRFTRVASGSIIGNALLISNGPSDFTTFYVDTNAHILYKIPGSGNSAALTGSNVINALPFQAQDYNGKVLTANGSHFSIQISLQFSNVNYSLSRGFNSTNYFGLQTRATPRIQ